MAQELLVHEHTSPHPVAPLGAHAAAHRTYPWYQVLWLTGVDYFSTLGYQPAIAFLAAGALSPIATAFLVLVTLVAAFPVYAAVARHSYAGQGSIAMLERLIPGWYGKLFVLVLIGFATTDFVITMTLSAADAALHAVENPLLHEFVGDHQLLVTLALLVLLAAVFIRGFNEALGVAMTVAIPYIALNIVVIGRAIFEIAVRQPESYGNWLDAVRGHGDWRSMLLASALIFPKLALGLSGFETGVSVMPIVEGDKNAVPGEPPAKRIQGTARLLLAAAAIMSVMLLSSSFVTTVLIPSHEFQEGGKASGRALAFLAHGLLGPVFGSIYDFSTIVILWFAGASAMAALLTLIPRYLPRFGMAPRWLKQPWHLVLVILVVNGIVTWVFKADVEAQGGAYATGVLVLMLSAAIAVMLAVWRAKSRLKGIYFGICATIFAYVLIENVHERPDGVVISAAFIGFILFVSFASRWWRSTELRVEELSFANIESEELWHSMRGKKVHLVPLGDARRQPRRDKAEQIRTYYKLDDEPLAFLHVELRDDTSDFASALKVEVTKIAETGNLIINITGAVAIANTIAWCSEVLDPISLFLDLRPRNPMAEALDYLLWGEGDVGMLVYQILVRHWEMTPEDDIRPRIFLFSNTYV